MTTLVHAVRQRHTLVSAIVAAASTVLTVNLLWQVRMPQAAWAASALVGAVSLLCWMRRSARPLAIGIMSAAVAQTTLIVALVAGGHIS